MVSFMNKKLSALRPKLFGQYFDLLSLIAPKKAAHSAFLLFSKVRKGRVQPQQFDFLEQAKMAVEQVSDHSIQVYHWPGRKATVLLVHGWESNTYRWRNLIKKLREADFDIIAFDAPAHGHSSGSHLNAALYEKAVDLMVKKYRPRFLVGHSMGGMTILYNQYRNPDAQVERMVTVGSPSELHEIMEHYQYLLGFNDRVYKALDTYIREHFGFGVRDFSIAKYSRSIDKKGLILHDRLDQITPYSAAVRLHENWKDSILVTTEGLGHSMHQDDVNQKIISFLEHGTVDSLERQKT